MTAATRDRENLTASVHELRDQLRKQAYLYESPSDFRAGVEAALNAFLKEESRRSFEAALAEIDLTD